MQGCDPSGRFLFEQADEPAEQSTLYQEHLKLTEKSRMAAFAGYLMPLWYSSIAAEHAAVRNAAGLFDCTHMGVIEVSGADAAAFLDNLATNDIYNLEPGRARYAYVLDAAGAVLDDIIVYRLGDDRFMVVVNAANEPKIKAYIDALLNDRITVDADDPERTIEFRPAVRDMRDTARPGQCLVDIALQGPASLDILLSLEISQDAKHRIAALKPFHCTEERIAGLDCVVSTTGYTGAKTGFEIFVHPDSAPSLWNTLLHTGHPAGLLPCGLGARDSLRIEAGLPLYGHELAGPHEISPFAAGYGWAVKLSKEFFIGQAPIARIAEAPARMVARIELPAERGVRPVRPGDAVLDQKSTCAGIILSSAAAANRQIALALVDTENAAPGTKIAVYHLARSRSQIEQGRKQKVQAAEKLTADAEGTVLSRFEKF